LGKRSNFERVDKDFYRTIDNRAGDILSPFLMPGTRYVEPCYGQGDLARQLSSHGHSWTWASDISTTDNDDIVWMDALELTGDMVVGSHAIITNPPWSRPILHKMIVHFSSLKPTWLLFDADWAHTLQSREYMKDLCTDIVSVGRLKWIPDTNMSGKDNCACYRFDVNKEGHTRFHGR
jgi:hypothetical protein